VGECNGSQSTSAVSAVSNVGAEEDSGEGVLHGVRLTLSNPAIDLFSAKNSAGLRCCALLPFLLAISREGHPPPRAKFTNFLHRKKVFFFVFFVVEV
jgi:hypothetical protein